MAEFRFLCAQQLRELCDGLRGVDDAGRIVRGVHDDGLGLLSDERLQDLKIDLEGILVRCSRHKLCAAGLNENAVLREEGREGDDLVPGGVERGEGDLQGSGGAAGHIEIVLVEGRAEAAVQVRGDCLTGVDGALGGGVAVEIHVGLCLKQFDHGAVDRFRRRDVRVSEAEIVDVLRADLRAAAVSEFKDLTDHRALVSQFLHGFVDHGVTVPFMFPAVSF